MKHMAQVRWCCRASLMEEFDTLVFKYPQFFQSSHFNSRGMMPTDLTKQKADYIKSRYQENILFSDWIWDYEK